MCKAYLVVIGVCLVFRHPATAIGQERGPTEIVARILADWKGRQDHIHSVQVEVSGTQFHPKGRWDDDYGKDPSFDNGKETLARLGHVPPEDTRHPLEIRFLLDFDKSFARKETDCMVMYHPKAEFVRQHRTHLFDGNEIKVFEPREKNTSPSYLPAKGQPDVWIQTRGFASAFFANEDNPVFWACGSVRIAVTDMKTLKFPIDPRNFLFKGYAEINGTRCATLRTPSLLPQTDTHYEYWVDPNRASAILRSQLIIAGKVNHQIDANWHEVGGNWIPKDWRFMYFWDVGTGVRLDHSLDCQVDRFIVNPRTDAADFDVKLKPGMVVRDENVQKHGVIGPDGTTLLPLSALEQRSRWPNVRMILFSLAGFGLVLLVALYLHRKRVSHATR